MPDKKPRARITRIDFTMGRLTERDIDPATPIRKVILDLLLVALPAELRGAAPDIADRMSERKAVAPHVRQGLGEIDRERGKRDRRRCWFGRTRHRVRPGGRVEQRFRRTIALAAPAGCRHIAAERAEYSRAPA